MKEFLALVIASFLLGSTGYARQNQDFERSPTPDRNTMGRQMERGSVFGSNDSTARPSAQSEFQGSTSGENQSGRRPVGRLDIVLNDGKVQELRNEAYLEAAFPDGSTQNINEICFGYQEPMQLQGGSFGLIEPSERRQETLVFDFGETDLQKILNSTLRFRLEPEEVGRYRTVGIRYRGSTRPQESGRDKSVGLNNRNNLAGESSSQFSNQNLLQPAIDTFRSTPGSGTGPVDPFRGFAGGSSALQEDRQGRTMPDLAGQRSNNFDFGRGLAGFDQGRQSEVDQPGRMTTVPGSFSGGNASDGRSQPAENERREAGSGLGGSGMWGDSTQRPLTPQQPYTNDPRQYMQNYVGRQAADLSRQTELQDLNANAATNPRSNQLRDWEQTLRQYADELQRRERQLKSDERIVLEQAGIVKQRLDEIGSSNRFSGSTGNLKFAAEGTMQDRERQLLLDRLDQAEKTNRTLSADLTELLSDFNRLSHVVYQGGQTSSITAGNREGRLLRTDSGLMPNLKSQTKDVSVNDAERQTGFPGPNRASGMNELEQKRYNRNLGVLYFFLVGSLALNLYLAWISRNFYVRYGELADELRETFASSN